MKIFTKKFVLDYGMSNTYCVINCYPFKLLKLVKNTF